MLSRVNGLKNRERDSLKGWFRAEVYSDHVKLGCAKHAQTNLGYVVWREIYVCIRPHCSSTALPFPQEGNQAYGSGGSSIVLSLDHQGMRTPVCTPHTECPEYLTHKHTGTDIKSTLWKCFTVKWSFGWRANGDLFSTGWHWVPQVTLVVVYRVAQPKTIFPAALGSVL